MPFLYANDEVNWPHMNVSRNSACPCGSGKKFKHCCQQVQSVAPRPVPPRTTQALAQARQFSQEGRSQSARQRYLDVLRVDPNQTEALYGLALMDLHDAAPAKAARLLRQAIKTAPGLAILHDALGTALLTQGRPTDAVAHFRQANTLEPGLISAWYNLAVAQEACGQTEQAKASYRRCLRLDPNHAAANNNLGNVYRRQGQPEKAMACYRQALAAQPELVQARSNLAMAHSAAAALFHQQDNPAAALLHFEQAVALEPGNADYQYNLGCCQAALGDHRRSIGSHRRALAIDPKHVDAHLNLGFALRRKGDLPTAIRHYRLALELQPDRREAMHQLASALRRLGQTTEAIEILDRALSAEPENVGLYSERGSTLKDQGRLDEAIIDLRKAAGLAPERSDTHSNLLLALNYADDVPAAELFADHCHYGQRFTAMAQWPKPRDATANSARKKIRIGYVSADLRMHSVSYFLEPVLRHHDRQSFEIFAYYNDHRLDAVSQRMRSCCDAWREVAGLPDEQLAATIQNDEVDILVDLSGHSGGNRLPLFARRAAAIQITWLGYPNSTGVTGMDYRITDEYTDPDAEGGHCYSEELIRLANHFSCYQPPVDCPEVVVTPATAAGVFTFGCFNNVAKLSPTVLNTWGCILDSVPGSRLLLKARALVDPQTAARIQSCFLDRGIEPERIVLMGRDENKKRHLQRYAEVDIALDSFPYNGTTTTCEALWMGVPVIALKGKTHRGRVSASILDGLGLGEWVAADLEQYIDLASALTTDLKRLQSLRGGMRERMRASTLLDGGSFTARLEAAYRSVWSRLHNVTEVLND